MKILFLSRWYPYPPNNGAKLRIYNLLCGLSEQHDVTLLSFLDQPDVEPNVDALLKVCRNVYLIPYRGFNPQSRHARLGFLSTKPRSVIDTFSRGMANLIERELAANAYDVVIASEIDMAGYYKYFEGIPAIFEEIEVGVLYEQYERSTGFDRLRYWLTWQKHRFYLIQLMNNFRAATVVSAQERDLLRMNVFRKLHMLKVIPNGVKVSTYDDVVVEVEPNTMIFTGSFSFTPNYEAMVWFLQKVFPIILDEIPDARLIITGKHGGRSLPTTNNVILTGFVDDIRPYLKSATVSLAPIWTGGGTRLKILEAMAIGTPVVATSKGAEGLDVISGEHLFLADGPEQFATAVIKILNDSILRQSIANSAKIHIMNNFDWQVIIPELLSLIDSISNVKVDA